MTSDPSPPTANEVFASLDYLLKLQLLHPNKATTATNSMMREIALKVSPKQIQTLPTILLKSYPSILHTMIFSIVRSGQRIVSLLARKQGRQFESMQR